MLLPCRMAFVSLGSTDASEGGFEYPQAHSELMLKTAADGLEPCGAGGAWRIYARIELLATTRNRKLG